ncbi:MAG TPA: 5-(carboxyamino)imidazole ribonucleotide synthase [Candidatus Margulisiibacteriota bacterium]|nr:5-(carboxyamino)imidazole ribonucleotide synthase [Candidatus Margulisiibacteriota bacterium]
MTTVGVLGGGQLGRLLALAGYPLGLRFRFLDPAADAPAGHVADHIFAPYDEEHLARFAADVDVVTYEFENVPAGAAAFLARRVPVYPPPRALEVTQDRLEEKLFLRHLQIPTAEFAALDDTWGSVFEALERLALPVVMKRRRLGYDGGGQRLLRTMAEVEAAWVALGSSPAVLEGLVGFTRELSLIAVRGRDGDVGYYPLVENRHVDGILRHSLAPAPNVEPRLQAEAEDYAARVLTTLGYVGVLTVEFFERDGRLLVNELAPRVHNSGHWTIEGAATSQFENHLRAILGLPLGSTLPVGCSAMVNLIGTLPDPQPILRLPDTHLHLYGKAPRRGRKLGHVTARVAAPGLLEERVRVLQHLIGEPDGTGTGLAHLNRV